MTAYAADLVPEADTFSLSLKLALPNQLDDYIGKVVREGAYLERRCASAWQSWPGSATMSMSSSWDRAGTGCTAWLSASRRNRLMRPSAATHKALPDIGQARADANDVWKQRNAVVHASWRVYPLLFGGTCDIATSNGGEVAEDEYHVERSIRRKFERQVEHRYVDLNNSHRISSVFVRISLTG
jgi:hypothetical protein